jgi:hypothetical protein
VTEDAISQSNYFNEKVFVQTEMSEITAESGLSSYFEGETFTLLVPIQ